MTIAACYVSTEGVVLGADSSVTLTVAEPGQPSYMRHYNFAQKVFQIGEHSTLGIVFWGQAGTPRMSHRGTIARFANHLRDRPPLPDMAAVATEWAGFFWGVYKDAFAAEIQLVSDLDAKPNQTPQEKEMRKTIVHQHTVGFCIGGNLEHDLTPRAFEVVCGPHLTVAPQAKEIPVGQSRFWGAPLVLLRVLKGIDPQVLRDIQASGKWTGTEADIKAITDRYAYSLLTVLPVREAVDYVHSAIYTTIKAMKFSQLPPICGGPVELAVITADRHFRWVRHKSLDAALIDGETDYA